MNAVPITYGHRGILSLIRNHGQRKNLNHLCRVDKRRLLVPSVQYKSYRPSSSHPNFVRLPRASAVCSTSIDTCCNPLKLEQSARRNFSTDPPTKKKTHVYVWEQTISAASSASVGDESDDESKSDVNGNNQEMKILRRKLGNLYRSVDMSKENDLGIQNQHDANSSIEWELVKPSSSRQGDSSSNFLLSKLSSTINGYKSEDLTKIQNLPFIHHFLPANYPHSVSPSYLTYATYCGCGAVAGSAAMVLSTQALLVAVGVGTQSAAPMAAALNWVMKDGLGQLGGVIFASQLGKGGLDVEYWRNRMGKWNPSLFENKNKKRGNFQRGTADTNPKRWRMVAALALDLSTLLEIFTPWLGPELFLPCASIANVGKNVGFLAASASRAAIHQSLCAGGSSLVAENSEGSESKKSFSSELTSSGDCKKKRKAPSAAITGSNLGDVTAKAGSQAIVASLLGTAVGIFLSQTFCSDHGTAGILAGFVVLSAIHQVCTYKALRAVPLKTLDRHRLHLLLDDYVAKNYENIVDGNTNGGFAECDVLTPFEIAERESFLPVVSPDDSVNWLSVGAPLSSICPDGMEELDKMMVISEKYIMKAHLPSSKVGNGTIQVTFFEGANDTDLLRGMYHAYITRFFMSRGDIEQSESYALVQKTHVLMDEHFPHFLDDLQGGEWQLGSGVVNVECGSSNRFNIQKI